MDLPVTMTLQYAVALASTPKRDRAAPRFRFWLAPLCWFFGHKWGERPWFEISAHRLQFCSCCREEVAGRTRISQLLPRPTDTEDLPWFGFDLAGDEEDGA